MRSEEEVRRDQLENATLAQVAWLRRIFWLLLVVWVIVPAVIAVVWMLAPLVGVGAPAAMDGSSNGPKHRPCTAVGLP
jgi:hypothetical protein